MPHTIQYHQLSNVLPQQRLSIYKKVFKTVNDVELHGSYLWSIKVGASIQPLLSALEIALRNSIHISASNIISSDWYDKLNTRTRKQWDDAKRDKSNIRWHQEQISKIKKKLNRKTPPKGMTIHDLLVAKMDFGFWDNLLRECFSINGDKKALWPQCIPLVFPNLPKGKGHTNASIQALVSTLRELRNDIAHNSPIWKHKNVVDDITAVAYVNSMIDEITDLIGWLSSEKVNWIEVNMLLAEAKRIASIEYLHLCQRKNMDNTQEKYSRYKRRLRTKLKILKADKFQIIETKNNDLFMITKISQ